MQTDKIDVNNRGLGLDKVRRDVEMFAQYQQLDSKETLRLNLLAEEMMGMVQGIVGKFAAYFWLDGNKEEVDLHLEAYISMNPDRKEGLLAVSASGKNMAAKGIMGKVRDVMENFLLNYEEVGRYASQNGIDMFAYDEFGMMYSGMDWMDRSWSLERYKGCVMEHMTEEAGAEAWDELEKSIVGRLADDVRVGVRSNHVEVVIKRKF